MDYQQKKSIVSIAQAVVVLTAYGIYAIGNIRRGAAGMEDVHFFATAMLVFIGIGIALTIAIQIIFHILLSVSIAVREREKESKEIESAINAAMVEDERDKLIELKSMRITCITSMLGFIAGLVLIALDYPVSYMLNLLFLAGGLGAIGEEIAKLIYYRAGGRHA